MPRLSVWYVPRGVVEMEKAHHKEKRSRDMIPLKDEDANGLVVTQASSTLG